MGSYVFKLPDLGEGTVESEIVQWRVQPGDFIEVEHPLVDMMTDKATVEITAPVSGKVVKLAGQAGDMIAVGAELVVFETGAEPVTAPAPAPFAAPTAAATTASAPLLETRKAQASPAVRRRARDAGIDLATVQGSGPAGRVTREDIASMANPSRADSPKVVKRTGQQEIKLIGLRRKIAEQLSVASDRIPHFTYVEEVDVTELRSEERRVGKECRL